MGNMGMRELGDLIRVARERLGVRAYDLSYAIGQNPSWLSRIEDGKLTHPPAPGVLSALSDQLGIRQADMLEAIGYELNRKPDPIPDDPREVIIERIRKLPREAGVNRGLEIAVSVLEQKL